MSKNIFSTIQLSIVVFLVILGIYRLTESGLDYRAFISFGLAIGNLLFVVERHSR